VECPPLKSSHLLLFKAGSSLGHDLKPKQIYSTPIKISALTCFAHAQITFAPVNR
jgi:hypothetical protein